MGKYVPISLINLALDMWVLNRWTKYDRKVMILEARNFKTDYR